MKILVLLSAYNGARYLREQMDSILCQDGVDVDVLVRDDGSTDTTQEILSAYARNHQNVIVRRGPNLGFSASFHQLLRWTIDEFIDRYDYFAFSDQDDYWMPDKLISALRHFDRADSPKLYLSNVRLADENLVPGQVGNAIPADEVSPAQALIDVYGLGCTFCFNKGLLLTYGQVTTGTPPSHDRWILLIAKWFGEVVYDRVPHMLYRQHGGNVYGDFDVKKMSIGRRVRLMLKRRHEISDHAVLLYRGCACPSEDRFRPLSAMDRYRRNIGGRLMLIYNWSKLGFSRNDFRYNVKKKIKVLLGCV